MTNFVSNNVASGNIIFASDHNEMGSRIAAVVNGGIDNTNINASAAVATSKLADDAGITTAKLADGSVTPAKLLAGTGTSWPWQSWTTTWTNVTVGNGTLVSNYQQTGKTVTFVIKLTLGSTSTLGSGTDAIYTLPVTATSDYAASKFFALVGNAAAFDTSASAYYPLLTNIYSTTQGTVNSQNASGTYIALNSVNSAIPITWATGDVLFISGTYQAA